MNYDQGDIFIPLEQLEKDMLGKDTYSLIKELFKKGMAKKSIARLLSCDVETVRRHLKKEGWTAYKRHPPQVRAF